MAVCLLKRKTKMFETLKAFIILLHPVGMAR